jgi:hypothetical protein
MITKNDRAKNILWRKIQILAKSGGKRLFIEKNCWWMSDYRNINVYPK